MEPNFLKRHLDQLLTQSTQQLMEIYQFWTSLLQPPYSIAEKGQCGENAGLISRSTELWRRITIDLIYTAQLGSVCVCE